MTDVAAEFFEALDRMGHQPLLEKATGTVRFDVVDGTRTQRWFVILERGDVSVSRKNTTPDCVIRTDRALFNSLVRNRANAMAAFLRGELTLEGNPELLVLIQRVLPLPAVDES